MSRSRRASRTDLPSAPRLTKNWLRDAGGRVQGGWLLAVSLLCCALAVPVLRVALAAGARALFDAWGIGSATVLRAPLWARLLWRWQGSVITVLAAVALIGLSLWLRGLWLGKAAPPRLSGRRLFAHALIGLGLAALWLALGLIPDSLRPEWPLGEPRFTLSLIPLCLFSLIAALSEELFSKWVLLDGVASRWGRAPAVLVACAWFFLAGGGLGGTVLSALNVLLLGALCCAVYLRRGLWAATGLRWGWGFATAFVFGFGGGEASMLRFYGVSETLLTGGDAGPMYGLWSALLFFALLAWTERETVRMWTKKTRSRRTRERA